MKEGEFKLRKKLEDLRHKNKMEEIKAEMDGRVLVENIKFENIKSVHRLKRADMKRHDQKAW